MDFGRSPNFGDRRDGLLPEFIVIHYTAMSSCAAAHQRLCDPAYEVSAHWLIGMQGDVHLLVPEDRRAWHAGAGSWQGKGDMNSRSIGIELDNDGSAPFSEPLMRALEALLPGIMDRWSIPASRVIAHSDMAPGRKIDPGPHFDWRRLALQGLASWVDDAPLGDPAAFDADACAFGYASDISPELRLEAFRLRFRPWGRGPVDVVDAGLIRALLRA